MDIRASSLLRHLAFVILASSRLTSPLRGYFLDGLLATALIFVLMAIVVVAFRVVVRRPVGVSLDDPPGVRTVAVFDGDDPEFFQDDRPDGPLVGKRLFDALCRGLSAGRIGVEHRGRLQNAQQAECAVGPERFALVLEWVEGRWVVSVEWVPRSGAERRHLAWTHQVFAPRDSPCLRRLLATLDAWLKNHPKLSGLQWHRKEQWFAGDRGSAASTPFLAESTGATPATGAGPGSSGRLDEQ